MGRFSPTVLPEPINLGYAIDRAAEGFLTSKLRKEDRRRLRRQEEREDREHNRYLRSLREAALREPGARTVGQQIDDPKGPPITQTSLRPVANANLGDFLTLEWERPAPAPIIPAEGRRMLGREDLQPAIPSIQDRAPYMTSGIVISPRAAREERTLATMLDKQIGQYMGPTREEELERIRDEAAARLEGGRPTPGMLEEDVTQAERIAAARRAPEEEEGLEAPQSLEMLETQIDDAIRRLQLVQRTFDFGPPEADREGNVDPVEQTAYDAVVRRQRILNERIVLLNRQRDEIVRSFMVEEGHTVPPEPTRGRAVATVGNLFGRLTGALPRREVTPEMEEEAGTRVAARIAARGEEAGPTLMPSAAAERRPTGVNDIRGGEPEPPTPPVAPTPPDTTETVSADLPLATRQEMAEKEWEELVDAGTDPDEATRILRKKYRLLGGQ